MTRDAAWTRFDLTAAETDESRIVDQFAADPARLDFATVQRIFVPDLPPPPAATVR